MYTFGKSSDTWWKINGEAIGALPRMDVWQLAWPEIQAAAELLERTVQLNLSIVGGVIYLDNGSKSCSVEPLALHRDD